MNKFLVIAAVISTAQAGAQLTYAPQLIHAGGIQTLSSAPQLIRTASIAAAPQLLATQAVRAEPFDPNPQYTYGYSVSDSLTGDSKTATESRNGDLVQGQYSLVEPDGSIRTVTYTADAINGFNAVVDRTAPTVAVAKTISSPALIG